MYIRSCRNGCPGWMSGSSGFMAKAEREQRSGKEKSGLFAF
jgi:hypothetical protein